MPIKTILLSDIRIDGQTQSRVSINQEVVAHYAELMNDGTTLPPIIVFLDGANYWLCDGFHRYHATVSLKKKANIIADVRKGTQRDAVLFSLNANVPHGLSLTSEDKRKAVLIMLADPEWSEQSDRAIARHCGCSHTSVSRLRNPEPEAKAVAYCATPAPAKPAETAAPVALTSPQSAGTSAKNDRLKPADAGTCATPEAPAAENAYSELDAAHDQISELQSMLAVANMGEVAPEDKDQAKNLIAELQEEVRKLRANLKAVTISRDTLMNELAMVKRQCVSLQAKLKKAA